MTVTVEDGIYERLVSKTIRPLGLESGIAGIGAQDEVKNFETQGGQPVRSYSGKDVEAAKRAYPFFWDEMLLLYFYASPNHIKFYIAKLPGISKIDPERQYSLEEAVSFLEPLGLDSLYPPNTEVISGKAIIMYAAKNYFAKHNDVRYQMLARCVLEEEVLLTPQFSNN